MKKIAIEGSQDSNEQKEIIANQAVTYTPK